MMIVFALNSSECIGIWLKALTKSNVKIFLLCKVCAKSSICTESLYFL